MAGPIAHIFCALAILHSGALKVNDEKAFIIGTSLPDIQYLGVITRETTHYPNIRWEDVIAAPTDFQKGILFHSLVDEVRIAQLEKPNEKYIPSLPIMRSQIMKFYEDNLIYSKINDLPKIMHYFDEILPEEKSSYGLADAALTQWHQFIKVYCLQPPSALTTHTIINQFPQLRSRIRFGIPSLIVKAYVGIAFRSFKKPRLINAMNNFYDNCVSLLTSNAHLAHQRIMAPA